jgi:hypothetical protein
MSPEWYFPLSLPSKYLINFHQRYACYIPMSATFLFSFLGCREPSPILLRSFLAYCTSTGWYWMMMNIEKSVEYLAEETEILRGKPTPVPLCLPRIPHDVTRTQTRAAAFGSQWLTTWATALPFIHRNIIVVIISDEATTGTWGSVQVTRSPQPVPLRRMLSWVSKIQLIYFGILSGWIPTNFLLQMWKKDKSKVVLMLRYLNTTSWRPVGEWVNRSMFSWPRQ